MRKLTGAVVLSIAVMTSSAYAVDKASEANTPKIAAGSFLKTEQGAAKIPFGKKFKSPPIVIVTPYFKGVGSGVTSIETVTDVFDDFFVVWSKNASNNYFVNW